MVEGGLREDGDHGALKFAGVGGDAQCEVVNNLLGELYPVVFQLFGDDGGTGFQVGNLQVGGQSPLETVQQARLETSDVDRRFVGGHDNLLLELVQMVENLEESLLGFGLVAGYELDVVDDEHVNSLVEPVEVVEVVALHGLHILLVEGVGADVDDDFVGEVDFGLDADGVDQVGFAEAHFGVDEQRVERGLSGRLGDGHAGGHGETVAVAHHVVVESEGLGEVGGDALFLDAGHDERAGDVLSVHGVDV